MIRCWLQISFPPAFIHSASQKNVCDTVCSFELFAVQLLRNHNRLSGGLGDGVASAVTVSLYGRAPAYTRI